MAESPIDGLSKASTVRESDMFVLEQSGVAKSLTWTKLKSFFTSAMEDIGRQLSRGFRGYGITDIRRTSGSGAAGATDTYTVTIGKAADEQSDTSTFTDSYTFYVYNGKDGTGTVNSINGVNPTGTNVKITAANVPYDDNNTVSDMITKTSGLANVVTTTTEADNNSIACDWLYTSTPISGGTVYEFSGVAHIKALECESGYGSLYYNSIYLIVRLPVEVDKIYGLTATVDTLDSTSSSMTTGTAYVTPRGIASGTKDKLCFWIVSATKRNSDTAYISGEFYIHLRGVKNQSEANGG